jgi:cytochrome P450
MTPITDVDLTSAAFRADPYPTYARLRAEAPVCRVKLPDRQTAWIVTRYDDAVIVLKDPRFGNDREKIMTPEQTAKVPWMPGMLKPLTRMMLNLDAPDHTRLRALVHKAFTPGLVVNMLGRIQTLTDGLLDAVETRDRFDLIRDYALPLPTTIIAEMLGVPVRDRHKFHRWSNALVSASGSTWGTLMMLPPMWAFLRYIRKLVKVRQAEPRDDLISALVQAREAGDRLSADELLAMIFLLLLAGHETTLNLIGNGVLALLEHPSELGRLRDDPGLIKPAVEELLRYDSAVQMASERYAREEVTIAGVTIAPGEMVHAMLGSANRDERQFDRPDELDITREANRHLAFGQGVHYCVGAPLARLEGQIAINTLLRRFPDLKLAVPPHTLRRRRGLGLRGLVSLPVTVSRRRAFTSHQFHAVRLPDQERCCPHVKEAHR